MHVTRDLSGCLDFVHKNFAFRTMTLDELVRRVAGAPGPGAGGGWPELVPRGPEFGEGEEVLYLRSIGENPRKVRVGAGYVVVISFAGPKMPAAHCPLLAVLNTRPFLARPIETPWGMLVHSRVRPAWLRTCYHTPLLTSRTFSLVLSFMPIPSEPLSPLPQQPANLSASFSRVAADLHPLCPSLLQPPPSYPAVLPRPCAPRPHSTPGAGEPVRLLLPPVSGRPIHPSPRFWVRFPFAQPPAL